MRPKTTEPPQADTREGSESEWMMTYSIPQPAAAVNDADLRRLEFTAAERAYQYRLERYRHALTALYVEAQAFVGGGSADRLVSAARAVDQRRIDLEVG